MAFEFIFLSVLKKFVNPFLSILYMRKIEYSKKQFPILELV
ncbi:hypothetical protein LEP1GSC037_4539 [Leptospira interrogans str. 2006001854]|uniref:Uncharacterized protein n=1 Tax=Leptospira interrogans str. 2006001854 TaxID=1001590 RepID=M6GKK4_LEPIR|nr:hypothetical protein LEP1GSC037_4539 [Leptospira interrogans str. 2006001854]